MNAPPAHGGDASARLAALLAALRDPAVRDLAWLLFSPDLLRAQRDAPLAEPWESPHEVDACVAWLASLDREPLPLHRALAASRSTRLGRYAEALLGSLLRDGPGATLVAAHLPLRCAGRTLGECDFLVETSGGRRLHWELAVKCYLCVDGGGGRLSDFVGPNLRDRFDRKRAHLVDHQLRLSARDEFALLGLPGPWHAQMFVKGWLFYRARGADVTWPAPAELARCHPRGWWVTHDDWPAFADTHRAAGWSVLPRLDWLAPRRLDAAVARSDAAWTPPGVALPAAPDALFDRIAGAGEPVMVAAFVADDDGYRELSRGFIVPNDWPSRARAFACG